MKKMLLLLLAAVAGNCFVSTGQQINCGTDLTHQRLAGNNNKYDKFIRYSAAQWAQYNQTKKSSRIIVTPPSDTSYEVPIVVHIIHSGEAIGTKFNPSDVQIDSLIDYLNQSWAATWSYYPDTAHGGVRIPIKFVLAKRDPNCGSTSGINRVDGSVLTGYADYGVNLDYTVPGADDNDVKSLSIWPGSDYYNIWIVKYIDGPSGGTAAAYANYPGPYYFGGTVIAAKYVYPLPSFSGLYYHAIPHELGHAFALPHTFEGDAGGSMCPDDTFCDTDGDGVCDTEPHMRSTSGTCASGTNPCTSLPYNNVQFNIMNYTSCPDRFTAGQRERVMFTLKNYRPSLITSLGGTAPGSAPGPKTACVPGPITMTGNDLDLGPWSVSFADVFTMTFGYTSEGYREYIDETCLQQPIHVTAGKTYDLNVFTSATEKVRAWIDYNNDGTFQATEIVMAHNGTMTFETHTAAVTIPATGVITDTVLRMRIMSDDLFMPDPTPCATLAYGQTEDYSIIIAKAPVSIPEQEQALNEIRMYPNPTSGVVNVISKNPVDLSLFSLDGKLLLHKTGTNTINVEGLSKGFYTLKITDSKSGLIKIMKLAKDR